MHRLAQADGQKRPQRPPARLVGARELLVHLDLDADVAARLEPLPHRRDDARVRPLVGLVQVDHEAADPRLPFATEGCLERAPGVEQQSDVGGATFAAKARREAVH